jgi:hypothetical protein
MPTKYKRSPQTGHVAEVVEHLFCKCEALSSNSKKKNNHRSLCTNPKSEESLDQYNSNTKKKLLPTGNIISRKAVLQS